MIIQCESCRRTYHLDDSRISPPGRRVRCSKCGHEFFVAKKENLEDVIDEEISGGPDIMPQFEDLDDLESVQEKTFDAPDDQETAQDTEQNTESNPQIEKEADQEDDTDLIDIPTEHQVDLEEYIEKKTSEQQEPRTASDEDSVKQEISPVEDNDNEEDSQDSSYVSINEPPNLFDTGGSDNDELEESESAEILENNGEESPDEKFDIDETEIASEKDQTEENNIETSKDISGGLTAGKVKRSSTGIFAKLIYTLITIAALIAIFTASLVLIINAGILPKGTLSGYTDVIEAVIPLGLEKPEPLVIITEHKPRWMNTVNGPVYIVSGLITNESTVPVHYIKLRSEYIAGDKKLYEDIFYAGNTFTDRELKASPLQNILEKLDQKNGDIDVNNPKKLAGLNYNIKPGESIPFFTVFPAEGRVLGLRYKLEVIDYKEASQNNLKHLKD